jgi:ABC-type phosphate/phosphonate transport system substrate-binding protein
VPYKKEEKARVFSKIQLYPQDPDIITKKTIMQLRISPLSQAFKNLNPRVTE